MPFGDRPILVTGAGGFIGGRLVEALHLLGARPRGSVRRWGSAARIGRFPVEIVRCDVTDERQVRDALEGVGAVIHCAYGDRRTTVDGTRNVLRAASELGVSRVVHFSTMEVYGDAEGEIDEETPTQRTGWEYADSKIDAEELCWQFASDGLRVTVLRPTLVYGPFSQNWTVEIAQRLVSGGRFPSGRDAAGVCNLVYVDDVVAAALLSLGREEAAGEAFNVNGIERLTWSEYLEVFRDALGLPPEEAAGRRRTRLRSLVMTPVRSLARTMLDSFEEPIMTLYKRSAVAKRAMKRMESAIRKTPSAGEYRLYGRQAFFPTDKAARLLGYQPRFPLSRGMQLSVAWLRHHGIGGSPAFTAGDGARPDSAP